MTNQPYPYPQTARSNMLPASALPQPRPQFLLSRSNTGLLVPLVPADELPFNISLQGVPRVMRAEDTIGMQCVGYVPYVGTTYKLGREVSPNSVPIEVEGTSGLTGHARAQSGGAPVQTKFLAPDHYARQALAQSTAQAPQGAVNAGMAVRPLSAHEIATNWRSNFNPSPAPVPTVQQTSTTPPTSSLPPAATTATTTKTTSKTQDLINAILSTTSGARTAASLNYTAPSTSPPPPSGTAPDSEKKQYCTYWIRTGECDYIQQGCLYKHEMPDRETLESIGFRNVPRWWAEKNAGIGRMRSGVMTKPKTILTAEMEGSRATLGKPKDISEWLKKSSDDDEEDGSVGSGSEAGKGTSGSEADDKGSGPEKKDGGKEVKIQRQADAALPAPLVPEPVKRVDSKQDLSATSPKQAEIAPAKITGPTPTPPAIDICKASTCSDLIDLAEPTSPTTSFPPPPNTPALTPGTSAASTRPNTPLTPQAPAFDPITPTKGEKKQIFIPKGESILPHIQDVRKRQLRERVPRAPAPGSEQVKVVPLEKQIQERQRQRAKARAQAQITILAKTQTSTSEPPNKPAAIAKSEKGLLASQHAPKTPVQSSESRDQHSAGETEVKLAKKSGTCGARRPAKK